MINNQISGFHHDEPERDRGAHPLHQDDEHARAAVREVEIIPLEVVCRNVAAGSLSQRLGIEEGNAAAALDHRVLLQEG
ncbi:MAG: phosphoribosylaminoimidazolesuccinocarboxamide synthase [Hyphomonadaceae bacterium]